MQQKHGNSNVTRNQECCAGNGQQQFTQPDLSAIRMEIQESTMLEDATKHRPVNMYEAGKTKCVLYLFVECTH
jgi:hypothetical protein